jgi:hypothetical protein
MENKALRYNKGKTQWHLVDFETLEGMVKVLEFGAKKYSPNNWKKGLSLESIADSLIRHLVSMQKGEFMDTESKLPHADHIQCNAMFLAYFSNKLLNEDAIHKEDEWTQSQSG